MNSIIHASRLLTPHSIPKSNGFLSQTNINTTTNYILRSSNINSGKRFYTSSLPKNNQSKSFLQLLQNSTTYTSSYNINNNLSDYYKNYNQKFYSVVNNSNKDIDKNNNNNNGNNNEIKENQKTPAAAAANEDDEVISFKPIHDTEKKDWKQKTKQVAQHYWLGTKLLGKNIGVAISLIKRVIKGHTLTRRERGLLIQTSADVLRLVPFLIIVIVPFLEFALPVILRFFPNLLPSTYTWSHEKMEGKTKRSEGNTNVAKGIRSFMEEVTQETKKDLAKPKEFFTFMNKVKMGETVSSDEVLKFSQYFKDSIVMEKITRPQLLTMHRYLAGSSPLTMWYSNDYLKQQIYNKIDKIKKDDKLIFREGLDSLTVEELVDAAIVRGIKVEGHSKSFIEAQLHQWLDLSVTKNVPPSLLILSRAFTLHPGSTPVQDSIEDTLEHLPQDAVKEVVKELPMDLSTEAGYEIAIEKLDDLTKNKDEIAEQVKVEKETESTDTGATTTAATTDAATETPTPTPTENTPPVLAGETASTENRLDLKKESQAVSDDDELEIHKQNGENNNNNTEKK